MAERWPRRWKARRSRTGGGRRGADSSSLQRGYLLCYDIADPVRLRRVHRVVKEHGLRIQYSVYLLEVNGSGLDRILSELSSHIHSVKDDVRVYPIPRRCRAQVLGRRIFDIGVTLAGTQLPGGFT
ncbi:CRISPR-associated endonuclease Cas2 [Thioalkalivibrio paradoxus]|uniref:CRISPR-associated endoribonuclease Cas2 n=1 Tax=Thioalkalivibrio paradoxus ARh 1 TaxID=713585 RepID=W0DNH3_9GAMM|nr:CRISPR-associated endonuclease Cas2 [Thioalkalivibrio paradoxus]AHE98430.1 CRISPR-associated protein Cas2 [Thioalkalivibrio paradoxus ARh 1]